MKRLLLIPLLALAAYGQVGVYPIPQVWTDNGTTISPSGSGRSVAIPTTVLGPKTIGAGANQLPAAAAGNVGWITVVTDAASGGDCTVGSGTSAALCRSNGVAWVPLGGAGGASTSILNAVFTWGGQGLVTGLTKCFSMPAAYTATAWKILVSPAGSTATVDVWRTVNGGGLPTVANTITSSGTPAIASGTEATGVTSGWSSSAFAVDDNVCLALTAVSGATSVSLTVR